MIPQINTVIAAYHEWFTPLRICACQPGDDPFNIIREGDKVGRVCRAHAWLERQVIGYQVLTTTGVCFPIPAQRLAGVLHPTVLGAMTAALPRGAKLDELWGNPLETEPFILELNIGGGKAAAQIVYHLSANYKPDISSELLGNKNIKNAHRGEHIVAYVNTSDLVSARFQQKDEIVNSILAEAPLVVLLNSFDRRTRKMAWQDLAYTRTYGIFIVVHGESW